MQTQLVPQLLIMLPELLLLAGALLLLLIGVFFGEKIFNFIFGGSLVLLVATWLSAIYISPFGSAFFTNAGDLSGAFKSDSLTLFSISLLLLGSFVCLLFIKVDNNDVASLQKNEYPILMLFAVLGMILLVSSNNFLSFYLGLELQSLSLYVLIAMNRKQSLSTEAAVKYFTLSSLASGLLLYGISLLYGFTGQIGFVEIANLFVAPISLGLLFGFIFVAVGLAFKISAVPFHMWAPDIYEGSSTPITAFLATCSKIAAIVILLRIVNLVFGQTYHVWAQVFIFLSLASMLLGSVAAIGQTSIKRLLAYSSIGHVGYILVGLVAGTTTGILSVMIYLAIYLIMSLGAFAFILGVRINGNPIKEISDLRGFAQSQPVLAAQFTILLFSFAGIPPFAGFFAKWYAFSAAVDANLGLLVVIALLCSVIAAFYYLRVIKVMWVDKPTGVVTYKYDSAMLRIILFIATFVTLTYALYGAYLYRFLSLFFCTNCHFH